MTPAVGDFVAQIEELLATADWPALDHAAVAVTTGHTRALVVLPHRRDPRLNVELEIDDRQVKISYGPERIPFSRRDEALRFLEMLGDGRVELVVAAQPRVDVVAQLPRRTRAAVPQDERAVAQSALPHRAPALRVRLNASVRLDARFGRDLDAGAHRRRRRDALEVRPFAAAGLARTISSSTAP